MSRQVLLANPEPWAGEDSLVAPSSPPSPHPHPRESSGQPAGGYTPVLAGSKHSRGKVCSIC